MVIPDLGINKQLDKPYSPLDKSPCIETAPTIGIGRFLADPVHVEGSLVLVFQVQCIGCFQLHAGGQFIAGDAGIQVWLSTPLLAVNAVQPTKQLSLHLGDPVRLIELTGQVQHRGSCTSKACPLVERGQETGLPVLGAVDRKSLGVVQYHVSRQVLIFTSQAIGHPGTHRGQARNHSTTVNNKECRFVGQVDRVHRFENSDPIHAGGQVRHDIRNPGSRFPVPGKLEGASHQRARRPRVFYLPGDLLEIRLAMPLVEFRLGIKQVHLAGSAIHEQVDHRFGFWFKVWLAGLEVKAAANRVARRRLGGDCGRRIEQVATKQPCQGRGVKPLPRALEPCSAVGRPGETGYHVQACQVCSSHLSFNQYK